MVTAEIPIWQERPANGQEYDDLTMRLCLFPDADHASQAAMLARLTAISHGVRSSGDTLLITELISVGTDGLRIPVSVSGLTLEDVQVLRLRIAKAAGSALDTLRLACENVCGSPQRPDPVSHCAVVQHSAELIASVVVCDPNPREGETLLNGLFWTCVTVPVEAAASIFSQAARSPHGRKHVLGLFEKIEDARLPIAKIGIATTQMLERMDRSPRHVLQLEPEERARVLAIHEALSSRVSSAPA